MTTVSIYHNPHCSKSRETLEILQNKGINLNVILYLDTPPSVQMLKELIMQLGFTSVRELIRTTELSYKQLNLDDKNLTEDQLLTALHQHPALIERPIVVVDQHAKIGRPPIQVMSLFKD
ncbi:arsenate reductase [Orbus hercynius]|uniref:Arsenate reductase n=1 Tax=Orbus hercynius TaxID=593135 RepID=A0A495RI67_9GAMM|nr:arsenate reductase (glutaredoxin) [Orbus hercynius]RKS87207.1 arsenate reductase [Orbus hercynius]